MADVNKLVFSVIRFLQDQKTNNSPNEEKVESIEVAIQLLESAYELDTSDERTINKYQVQRNLLDIFRSELGVDVDSDFSSLSLHEARPEEKAEAEGDEFMKVEKFSEALECYSTALKLDNKNSVYYCNRATAYSKLNKDMLAIEDCQKALTIDPQCRKAYGKMGIAYTALDDHESAIECYRKALELDPGNQSYQKHLEISEQKLQEMAFWGGFNMGPIGTPDISSLLDNPDMMQMAQDSIIYDSGMHHALANIMGGASKEGEGEGEEGIDGLLQVAQQLAQQMQLKNPELVEQLRSQMGLPQTCQNPSSQQTPNPDDTNKDGAK